MLETFVSSTERLVEIVRAIGYDQDADIFASRAMMARRLIVKLRAAEAELASRTAQVNVDADRSTGLTSSLAAEASLEPTAFRKTSQARLSTLVSLLGGYTRLTPRERQVLLLVIQGCSNREIADRLVISSGTAANHVARVLDKLGCRSRTQLLGEALKRVDDEQASGDSAIRA